MRGGCIKIMLKSNHKFQPQTRIKWGFLKKNLKIMGKNRLYFARILYILPQNAYSC